MYRSVRLLRATAPLASPAFRAPAPLRPISLGNNLAFKRVISTTPVRFNQPITGDRDPPKNKHNVENQNYTTTAREELKSVAQDIGEMISGRSAQAAARMAKANEISGHSHAGSVSADFKSMTTDLVKAVPQPALVFGLAGTLPYLGTSLSTLFLAREASRASQGLNTISGLDLQSSLDALHLVEHVQITYGAIILSFLGAIHWGMEFSKLGGEQGYKRLAIGVIPVLFAWPTTFLPHGMALVAQWFGFTGTWMIDQRASTNGWTTPWYSTYRFYLSLIVGFSIMATFAGSGWFGAGAGATTAVSYPSRQTYSERMSGLKRLDKVGEKNRPSSPDAKVGRVEGKTTSEFSLEESDDAYLKLVKTTPEEPDEEEEQAKEEEKQKNAEFQDKRDEHQQDEAPGAMKDTAKDRTGANANVQDESQKK